MKKYILLFLGLISSVGSAIPNETEFPFLYSRNLLRNPGFESGLAGWTASAGTFVLTTTSGQVGSGTAAASWDASAANQTLMSTLTAIPAGFYGAQGYVSCRIKAASGTATHLLSVFNGTTDIASVTVTSSTSVFQRVGVVFTMPVSGSFQLRIKAATNEPAIYIDDCSLGLSEGAPPSGATNATTTVRTESLRVTSISAGTCNISTLGGSNWVSGCTNGGTGLCSCTIIAGIFSTAPFCQTTVIATDNVTTLSAVPTTTNVSTVTLNIGANAVEDKPFDMTCRGSR